MLKCVADNNNNNNKRLYLQSQFYRFTMPIYKEILITETCGIKEQSSVSAIWVLQHLLYHLTLNSNV